MSNRADPELLLNLKEYGVCWCRNLLQLRYLHRHVPAHH